MAARVLGACRPAVRLRQLDAELREPCSAANEACAQVEQRDEGQGRELGNVSVVGARELEALLEMGTGGFRLVEPDLGGAELGEPDGPAGFFVGRQVQLAADQLQERMEL